MQVITKIDGVTVNALDLESLVEIVTPAVRASVEKNAEELGDDKMLEALVHISAVLLAVQKKIGALIFQREEIGFADHSLVYFSEELLGLLGLYDVPPETPDPPAAPSIVVPT